MRKPTGCLTCPFTTASTGFVPDAVPSEPRLAVLLKFPGKDEIVHGIPMCGKTGRYWEREFLWPVGLKREVVIILNVIRCYPNSREFPTGKLKAGATGFCRQWDGALTDWKPTVMGVSFNPAALLRNPQQTAFVKRAFERAVEMFEKGERPLLLLGEEARDVFAPWLSGALKRWQGHWWRV